MPIAPELRCFYGARWRKQVRPRIIARAQNHCECCGKPNRQLLWVIDGGRWFDADWSRWRAPGSELVDLREPRDRGVFADGPASDFRSSGAWQITTVLTIAHLNHTPGDDRDENLAALCQYCHLWHDRMQHARNARRTRCERKDAARPLLAGVDGAAVS